MADEVKLRANDRQGVRVVLLLVLLAVVVAWGRFRACPAEAGAGESGGRPSRRKRESRCTRARLSG